MRSMRHINRSRRIRKDSRRAKNIPGHRDYGEGRDANRYYRCWHCGYICDIERDALGGPDDISGISVHAYSQVDEYGDPATAGSIITSTTRYETKVDKGCPFCGSVNWKGEF